MAEPAAERTTIAIDGALDSRYERITSVCQRIIQTVEEELKKSREHVAKLTEINLTGEEDDDDELQILDLPPPPKGSAQVFLKPPLKRPAPLTMASVMTQANALLVARGEITAECRYWSTRWSKSKAVYIRESYCQIMRIVRSIAELLERFVGTVVPFWESINDKQRYIFGFIDSLAATVMPYFEHMVDTWGQWCYDMTKVHVDGCVCKDQCALFAAKWLVSARRAFVLPYIDVDDW
ncbi:hypothetical protein QBC37DRAFT_406765 [Rhypophila decipiens]|uniref:Uncharacterized protein n=1 Tax=Rhypophila decipiens TaxID=261697 RepID=A0AAN7B1I0_9PEZI|nr:hypothetical protein QBC37DRAFT_406765 [Rhypophila decipiens]